MADYGVRITLAASSPVPSYSGGIWSSGVARLSSSSGASGWTSGQIIEVSPLGEQVDIAQGGNYASIGDFDAVVLATWFPAFEAAGASLYGATVEVGTLSGATLTVRWSGIVVDAPWRGAELRIKAESLISRRHKTIPARVLTAQEFPSLPSENEGAPVPIIYGAAERMTPPNMTSDADYLDALVISTGSEDLFLKTTFIAIGGTVPAATSTFFPVVVGIGETGIPTEPTGWRGIAPNRYMEIVSGTGSGQRRLIGWTLFAGTIFAPSGKFIAWQGFTVDAPFDTIPDATSTIKLYQQNTVGQIQVADECVVSSVKDRETDFNIMFIQSSNAAGVVADVSAEFKRGEDLTAIEYHRPSEVFGITSLSDGRSASLGHTVRVLGFEAQLNEDRKSEGDIFCRASLNMSEVSASTIESDADTYFLFSAKYYGLSPHSGYNVQVKATRWDGTIEYATYSVSSPIPFATEDVNAFSSSILSDGIAGNFAVYAVKVDLERPLNQYDKILFGVAIQYSGSLLPPVLPTTMEGLEWINGATYARWNSTFGTTPVAGDYIRPRLLEEIALNDYSVVDQYSDYMADRFCYVGTGSMILGSANDWREITSVTLESGTIYRLNFATAATVPSGVYGRSWRITNPDDAFVTFDEMECGVAFAQGEIAPDSEFIVDAVSGRTFASRWSTLPSGKVIGDPITNAAHVAQDILLRDLGLDQATEIGAGYDTVPAYPARVALVEQEDSAAILARMCREFNWVGGHDNAGKETLVPWLSRLYSASSDYSVANADIIENSIDGIDATSVDDVVTLPRVSSDWTQKDGFRQSGTVTDCTASPSTLTASNYLQYISGFGDYSTALDSYSVLHEAWKRNGVRNSDQIEYRYGGNPTDLLVPARLEWAASRKDLLTFRLSEEHTAAAAYVGQRIDITHKRYTGGGTAYGTLVARYWYPEDGHIQLTVMLDPVEFVIENQLYIDTIDASGATPSYIDQIDGVTGLYIDQTGA
jgi:hypothetical protein